MDPFLRNLQESLLRTLKWKIKAQLADIGWPPPLSTKAVSDTQFVQSASNWNGFEEAEPQVRQILVFHRQEEAFLKYKRLPFLYVS